MPDGKDKAKGANAKRKMESIDSHAPKKTRKHWTGSTVLSARNMRACTPYITPRSASATTGMEATRSLGVQLNPTSPQMERTA
jgi:hypothetical protein